MHGAVDELVKERAVILLITDEAASLRHSNLINTWNVTRPSAHVYLRGVVHPPYNVFGGYNLDNILSPFWDLNPGALLDVEVGLSLKAKPLLAGLFILATASRDSISRLLSWCHTATKLFGLKVRDP